MSEVLPILGIPALRGNPFQARPLEKGQSRLLAGREEVSARWARFLKTRNTRMILLIGETGSGKTSLLRCVSEEAGKSVHLDMFPSQEHAHRILHEIHGSMIGFEIPSTTQELVARLVTATEEIEGPLPLITLDYSNADGKSLAEVSANLISPLERLNAMVVVVLSTEQRAQWPESLVNRFDHFEIIKPLEKAEVKELCESRMASTSKIGWKIPDIALDYIIEKTNGIPSKVMRVMRDLVDEERANPRDLKFESPQEEVIETAANKLYEEDEEVEELGPEAPIGFDLDLEELAKEPVRDSYPAPLPAMGGFGALAARNRVNKQENPPFDKKAASDEPPDSAEVDANTLWVADKPEAVLITETVEEEAIEEEESIPEESYYDPETQKIAPQGDVEGLFGQLLNALRVPEGVGIADLLSAIRRPVIGQKESNPLDIQTLRNLSRGEATLIEVGSDREFSPSDARLQDKLEVRRPRMSQMCNRLYRAGILSVQQKGRTRMFKLTNDARAQLVAWGMMEASI
jgi:energy-coupling factor transporter ATP-binding protein EcfA2